MYYICIFSCCLTGTSYWMENHHHITNLPFVIYLSLRGVDETAHLIHFTSPCVRYFDFHKMTIPGMEHSVKTKSGISDKRRKSFLKRFQFFLHFFVLFYGNEPFDRLPEGHLEKTGRKIHLNVLDFCHWDFVVCFSTFFTPLENLQ